MTESPWQAWQSGRRGVAEGASEDGEDAADRPTGEPGLLELEDEDGDPVRADLANPTMTEARVDVTIESRAVELPRAWAQVVLCCKPLIPTSLRVRSARTTNSPRPRRVCTSAFASRASRSPPVRVASAHGRLSQDQSRRQPKVPSLSWREGSESDRVPPDLDQRLGLAAKPIAKR
jgi:hypothetical protein